MKKGKISSLMWGAAFAMLTLNACTNDTVEEMAQETTQPTDVNEVMFIVEGFGLDKEVQSRGEFAPGLKEDEKTKTASFAWVQGDMIGILPQEGSQVYFMIDEIDPEKPSSAKFTGGSWGLKAGHEYAAYFPFIQDIMLERTEVPVDYSVQTYKPGTDGRISPSHAYMAAHPVQREDGGLNFQFKQLGALVEVVFTLPEGESGAIKQLELIAPTAVFPVTGTFDLTEETVSITPTEGEEVSVVTVHVENLTADAGEPVSVFFMLPPMSGLDVKTLSVSVVYGEKNRRLPLKVTSLKDHAGAEQASITAKGYYTLEIEAMEQPGAFVIDDAFYFSSAIISALNELGGTKLRFVAGSMKEADYVVYEDNDKVKAYAVRNGDWLEVHTLAKEFMLPENCSSMFYDWSDTWGKLTSLDLSSFNTENVTDMSYMFRYCTSLTSLDLSGFNTEKVTNMAGMFSYCESLTSLDLSGFNTEKVMDMAGMFSFCESLTSLDLSGFNTEKVTGMRYMFDGCSALTSLDLSKFNTANVTDMFQMFFECRALDNLDLTSFTFVAEGCDYGSMFYYLGYDSFVANDNTPVAKIYVTKEGYKALEGKELDLICATLEISSDGHSTGSVELEDWE